MTAPVTMEKQTSSNNEQWLMHFVMPSEYTLETLEKPNNSNVNIRQIYDKNHAVIRFSGFSGGQKVQKNKSPINLDEKEWFKA